MLESDQQLANTEEKLRMLQEHIAKAYKRPETPERNVSIRSLLRTERQLKEEIIRYRSSKKLRNVG